ncbi:UDP-glucose 4-epimerase GalE [Hydrogenophaga sp.]|uniref:UDP-glucose 4-epimerase GalE n=1 Tax=Hydrogenophaga sp. TaxID=1904254 RepID=UPI003F6AF073
MNILITGGTGYIGSHTAVLLAQEGHRVVLFDNLSNSTTGVLRRLSLLGAENIVFEQGDVRTSANLAPCLLEHEIEAVIHLAGEKGPLDSLHDPLAFHSRHLLTTLSLLQAMGVMEHPTLIYGGSAAVYGHNPLQQPLAENHPTAPLSPYASAHRYAETLMQQVAENEPQWRLCSLRMFNVMGAHPSGLIGEDLASTTVGLGTHLARVAAGRSMALYQNGSELPTPDGSPLRDYVHVMDVAQAQLDALAYVLQHPGFDTFNIGSGHTCSVRGMARVFEHISGQPVMLLPGEARSGEPMHSQACLQKTRRQLGWEPSHSLDDMCRSSWNHLLTAIETGAEAGRSVSR